MSSNFDEERERVPVASDTTLKELTDGKHRVRLLAHVVNKSNATIIINDGETQISISSGDFSGNLEVGMFGRFILAITKDNSAISGFILAFHPLNKEELQQYKRIKKLERNLS